jgi:tripeptidyl-peptidase-1
MLPPIALFLAFAHLAVITSCKPLKIWQDLVVKHSWDQIPRGWECIAPAPADYVFELKIALKQPRIDELISNLMQISDPEHPRFVFA